MTPLMWFLLGVAAGICITVAVEIVCGAMRRPHYKPLINWDEEKD